MLLLHYMYTWKLEHSGTRAYLETFTEGKYVVNGHLLALMFSVGVAGRQDKLPTVYCLPRPHKR